MRVGQNACVFQHIQRLVHHLTLLFQRFQRLMGTMVIHPVMLPVVAPVFGEHVCLLNLYGHNGVSLSKLVFSHDGLNLLAGAKPPCLALDAWGEAPF